MREKCDDPARIQREYESGVNYKASLGSIGLYEQSKKNERFFVGDQWWGARCGNDRPLVRHNVIKRIGDYKMAVISSSPITVNYSADGVPNTLYTQEEVKRVREMAANGNDTAALSDTFDAMQKDTVPSAEEVSLVMSAMTDYHRVTAERVQLNSLNEQAMRNAYISGTGLLYTYWDERIRTGLYADESRKHPIKGDIACEVLDIENVYFGDPNTDDVQEQPYIIIAQRRSVEDVRREARRNKRPEDDMEKIKPDDDGVGLAGDRSENELEGSKKTLVLTKLWKEWNDDGTEYTVMAVRVCNGATVRKKWDVGIRMYPISKFSWERRKNCVYGDSEITYLIPNQIAINRMITASVWAVMQMGVPIMVVNGDIVQQQISNEPGQIIRVFGNVDEVQRSITYVQPPNFSPKFDQNIESIIANTLSQAGANDAALGNLRADNAAAIIAVREAATTPMQTLQNRYYSFCEDTARIFAEFWVTKYGKRSLRVEDESGVWYMPFDGNRYKDMIISATIDVGASTLWSEAQAIQTLDNLLQLQIIDGKQYLERMPRGIISNTTGLIAELQRRQMAQEQMAQQQAMAEQAQNVPEQPVTEGMTEEDVINGLSPEARQILESMPEKTRTALIQNTLAVQGGL